jgi:hypothetical protein
MSLISRCVLKVASICNCTAALPGIFILFGSLAFLLRISKVLCKNSNEFRDSYFIIIIASSFFPINLRKIPSNKNSNVFSKDTVELGKLGSHPKIYADRAAAARSVRITRPGVAAPKPGTGVPLIHVPGFWVCVYCSLDRIR